MWHIVCNAPPQMIWVTLMSELRKYGRTEFHSEFTGISKIYMYSKTTTELLQFIYRMVSNTLV